MVLDHRVLVEKSEYENGTTLLVGKPDSVIFGRGRVLEFCCQHVHNTSRITILDTLVSCVGRNQESTNKYLKLVEFNSCLDVYGNCDIASHSSRARIRIYLYEEHNRVRSGLALGVKMFRTRIAYQKRLMKMLVYNCYLERSAYKVLERNFSEIVPGFAVNRYESYLTDLTKWMSKVEEAMLSWIEDILSFVRMTYPTSTYMGCAFRIPFENKRHILRLLCLYSGPVIMMHDPSLEKPCINDRDCDRFWPGHYRCQFNYGLCYTKYFDSIYWIVGPPSLE